LRFLPEAGLTVAGGPPSWPHSALVRSRRVTRGSTWVIKSTRCVWGCAVMSRRFF
jgi:hypothetical protein